MPCEPIKGADGRTTGYACSRGPRTKRCAYAGCKRSAPFLCDYPVTRAGVAGTCDRPCCGAHCKRVAPDRDYCQAHVEHDARQKAEPPVPTFADALAIIEDLPDPKGAR